MFSFRSRRMNDTVSGVSAGVVPKTVAPGSEATLMPDATDSFVFGPGPDVAAEAELANAASGVMTAATPSTTAADSRVFPHSDHVPVYRPTSMNAIVSCG